jgi:O-methyltransferase
MNSDAVSSLVQQLHELIVARAVRPRIAIIGATTAALRVSEALEQARQRELVVGVYSEDGRGSFGSVPSKTFEELGADLPSIVVVASDTHKEQLLRAVEKYLHADTRILLAGYGHFRFSDPIFESEVGSALIPSLANGYPNSLVHIFQCLKNAARLRVDGIVAEFGMFKGGTTMLISRFIERLGASWRVYGFDSFAGFPAPRSPFDMYAHADCVFLDEPLVRRMFDGRNVEIVAGDIVRTVKTISGMPVVLAFVDTDNFSPANAVLDVIQDQVVRGGAIVFDHFTGQNRFLYTLGERMAAKRLLDDPRYVNLHDTGVFLRV